MAENLLTFSPLLLISVHQLNCFEIIHSFLCSHCCHKIYVWMNIKHLIVFHLSTLNTIKRNIKSAIFYFWWHFLWYITILFNIHRIFFLFVTLYEEKQTKKFSHWTFLLSSLFVVWGKSFDLLALCVITSKSFSLHSIIFDFLITIKIVQILIGQI